MPRNRAVTDTFGSGANAFHIEFVTIGDPGNLPDPNAPQRAVLGAPLSGSVDYVFEMGKYEISRELIEKANGEGNLGITLWDMTEFGGNGPDKPATGVTWMEAATFVNWLNTSSGYAEAYQLRGGKVELWQPGEDGYDAAGPLRNGQARYVLPSFNEWHKAAYYDSGAGTYYLYPTGSNARPRAVSNGTEPYTAVYDQTDEVGPADITLAGALSPYGTMGQGGNASEWTDTPVDYQQSLHVMGKPGDFRSSYDGLVSSYYGHSPASAVDDPFVYIDTRGFRVAKLVAEVLIGDFNGNGLLDVADMDDLTTQSARGMNLSDYDLNHDTLVDEGEV